MSRNLEKRLAEVERRLRDVARREEQGDCNCQEFTGAYNPEKFEEEMNRPCPAHGFRDLGQIFHTVIGPPNGILGEKDARVANLIATYEASRARDRESKLDDDSEEF